MAAMAARKSISIQDYPEHLNPFHEDDNHNKIRFWTLGRKLTRSNSITFSGIKELKNSWAFRSFMKKGKKGSQEKSSDQVNGETSPIVFRRALQYSSGSRSTVASPERYVYGGSITPLPRSRFQERLRSPSQYDANSLSMTPRMARSEVSGSRLSIGSTNPFDDEEPVPPMRTRRKKKRAPPPPPTESTTMLAVADISFSSETSELQISEVEDKITTKADGDVDLDEMNLPNIELKIIEDDDLATKSPGLNRSPEIINENNVETVVETSQVHNVADELEDTKNVEKTQGKPINASGSNEDILSAVSFPKVDIQKYRRNSSVNEDDIRLRRGNLEDFHTLNTKRSKSLNNNLGTTYMSYDINLNEDVAKDANGNDEPQKVICRYDETARKQSIDTISSTEREFMEIDKATRELEREISKLNSALNEDDLPSADDKLSVSEIKRRFDKGASSPNPIPKPRRSHYGGSNNSP